MLNKVVFPAPFGPISETIENCGMSIEMFLRASSPPELLRNVHRAQGCGRRRHRCPGHAHAESLMVPSTSMSEGSPCCDPGRELEPVPLLGDQALRPKQHHDHQREPEDSKLHLGQPEIQPELAGSPFRTSGIR